jgi:hypothetical protein
MDAHEIKGSRRSYYDGTEGPLYRAQHKRPWDAKTVLTLPSSISPV